MVFKYDPNKLNEYRKDRIFSVLPLFCIYMVALLPLLYVSIQDFENILLVISLTFMLLVFSCGISILILYIKAQKDFFSYQVECGDKTITITGGMLHKEVKIDKINKVLRDNKNNIYIVASRINKIKILHYIENIGEFEKYLSNISPIQQYNAKNNFFQYISMAFFIILMFVSKIGNLQLYLIFAFAVLLMILYSLIKLIMEQIKFRYKILVFIVDGYMLYAVARGIYSVLLYLKK